MPAHKYIFSPTREMWPVESINDRIPPVPLVDETGRPALDKEGNPK